jgi:post-segregation antitoxin (ccd killing protein)
MNETEVTLSLPTELLERAKSAHVDMRQAVIEALENKVAHDAIPSRAEQHAILEQLRHLKELPPPPPMPTREEIEAFIAESRLRLDSGEVEPRPLGYFSGQSRMSDDFDDELPDEFWFGEEA